jgi:thiol-disulfide isomerase/thioredoxin
MSWPVAAVAALSVVTVFNTLLCFAVIGRLRAAPSVAPPPDLDGPAVGTVVGAFATVTTAGLPLTSADVADAVVLFLSPGCGPCRDVAAALAARTDPAGEVVGFVLGSGADEEAAAFADRLEPYARVAFVEHDDPVTTAFGGIAGYPTLLRLRNSVVTGNGSALDEVVDAGRTAARW